jgi:septum formation protein
LGKPRDELDAFQMLSLLSGVRHQVYTGLAVYQDEQRIVEHECTSVTFRELSEGEIEGYLATGEPMDKAGSYGIQGRGGLFVERIDGDYFNVVGLPICRLGRILTSLGVKLL